MSMEKEEAQKRLGALFETIASEAMTLEDLSFEIQNDRSNSALIDALFSHIRLIGFLADLGATDLPGCITTKGGAEKWFLPPAYSDRPTELEVKA